MSATAPWWASEDGVIDLDRDEDAFTAHRQARAPGDETPDWVRAAGDVAVALVRRLQASGSEASTDPHEHGVSPDTVCRNCPICTLMRAMDRSAPELAEHLGDAARHLALAAASVLEAIAGEPGGGEPESGP